MIGFHPVHPAVLYLRKAANSVLALLVVALIALLFREMGRDIDCMSRIKDARQHGRDHTMEQCQVAQTQERGE